MLLNGLQKGGGAKRGGARGMGPWGGVKGTRGWNLYFTEVFNKTA